ARHAVAGVMREHLAEIVFTPYFQDAHPDHLAGTRIVEDARFDAKLSKIDLPGEPIYPRWLFYYYATHLRWVADPSFCFDISGHLETKLDSIRAYHTQFVLPEKNRRVVEWVEAAATYFGSRIGCEHAEPFYTKEPIGLNALGSLILG
ncbi:MAG: PIG-L deacetylase family protein, partial [Planctomycetota bacterium]